MVTSMVSIIMLIDVVSATSSHPAYLRGNSWEEPDRTYASALSDQTTQVFTSTATATSMPSVPLPDLMVSSVDNGGSGHGCAGVWGYSYRACILNRGEAPAAAFDVQLYGIGGRLETVGGLDADEETCLSGRGTITAVVVDVFNDVAELDETNNVARHFGVPTPGATCTVTPTITRTPTNTPTPTPTLTLQNNTFRAEVVPSRNSLSMGEPLEVTTYIYNSSERFCFGMPQLTLYVRGSPVLEPSGQGPVMQHLILVPGGQSSFTFSFRTIKPGTAKVALTILGEVTGLRSSNPTVCGPPSYWRVVNGLSETIEVAYSYMVYLPLVNHQSR